MKAILAALLLVTSASCSADLPSQADALALELTPTPLTVTFKNTGKTPIRILKPLDGSYASWIMPHYEVTVTDERGRKIPMHGRCGLFGHPYTDTKWPDDYLVTIPAGGTYKQPLLLNHNVKVAGLHSIRFQYVFRPETDQTPGGPYPKGLWRGDATSNTIRTRLESSP